MNSKIHENSKTILFLTWLVKRIPRASVNKPHRIEPKYESLLSRCRFKIKKENKQTKQSKAKSNESTHNLKLDI